MNKVVLVFLAAAVSSIALVACSDDGNTNTTTSSSSSSSGSDASSSSSSSGMGGAGGGGAGGAGGMAASSSSSSSGMGGGGGAGGGEMGLNGCVQAMAEDFTGMSAVTIQFAGVEYTPACIRVKIGTSVTFQGSFSFHPLQGGTVTNGVGVPDPMSPITLTATGMMASFTLSDAGDVPYYCTAHANSGMKGAIFVEP